MARISKEPQQARILKGIKDYVISQSSKDCLGHLQGSWTYVLNERLNEKVFKKVYNIIPLIIHLQKAKMYFENTWLSLP